MPDTINPSNGPAQAAHHRPYATLSEAEKWDWHADVYAFRRIILGVPESDRTSPCDQDGVWFDEPRVILATARYREKYRSRVERANPQRYLDMQREGRAIANGWARAAGANDIEDYADTNNIELSKAYLLCAASVLGRSHKLAKAREPITAAEMGVKADEIIPHRLVDPDDPRVVARLREMGAH